MRRRRVPRSQKGTCNLRRAGHRPRSRRTMLLRPRSVALCHRGVTLPRPLGLSSTSCSRPSATPLARCWISRTQPRTRSRNDSKGGRRVSVPLKFRDATLDDVAVIAGLQNAAAGALTARFGPGHWSSLVSERGAALSQRHARVRVGRDGRRILTVLRLAIKKPWAIDVSFFTPVKRPLYLTGMAVSVSHQRQGLGRLALADACTVAADWPADAIRLDAYDAEAGAYGFYARCGFAERGYVVYKGTPLRYYERLLP